MCSKLNKVLFDQRSGLERQLRIALDEAAVDYWHAKQSYDATVELRGDSAGSNHPVQMAKLREEQARARYVTLLQTFADFVLSGKPFENIETLAHATMLYQTGEPSPFCHLHHPRREVTCKDDACSKLFP